MLRVTETMLKRDQIYLSATHKDTAAALSLMEGLERFDVPRRLEVAPGMEPLARRRRVMRHGQENPRVTELPPLVVEKLGESAVMVLVCSSSSSTSRWIRAEVEEFYRTHPRGPIIPVVLDGEPNPDLSRQAFEKPCFPENLKKADIDRWVDGRGTDWAETAPVAALSTMLGVRVEQLIHHEALQTRRMRLQRSLAFGAMLTVLAMSVAWTFRWPVHEAAKRELTIYAERLAPRVERWLAALDGPIRLGRSGEGSERSGPPGASPPAVPEAPEPVAVPVGSTKSGFLENLPKADPVAFQLAANAWLDEAEKYLPDQLDQAERWIERAREGLEGGDGVDFGNELYRVHALSAVVAQRRRNSERSSQELLKAIDHWISIPIQDLEKREEEGFSILSTISPTPEWKDSAVRMVGWLGALPGDEGKISQRASRLIDLVETHPYLAAPVQSWLAQAASAMQPAPSDTVGTAAKFAMLRAALLRGRQDQGGALAALEEGERALQAGAKPDLALHRALAAQFRYRKAEYSGATVTGPDLEKNLNELQEGQSIAGWDTWFGYDLRGGWVRLGDMHLQEDAFAEAIGAYNRALEFSKNPEELAKILLKSGCAYRYHKDPAGAWDAFSLAIPIFEESKDDASLLTALWGGVLAARDLKRSKEGADLQQRATELQSKLGSSYKPPVYWRDEMSPVEFPSASAAVGSGSKPGAESVAMASATAVTGAVRDPAPAVAAPEPVPAAAKPVETNPADSAAMPAEGGAKPESAGELEQRIVAVQKKIAQLEADSKNRQTFRGLEELQNLYAELDGLLRRKLTGKAAN